MALIAPTVTVLIVGYMASTWHPFTYIAMKPSSMDNFKILFRSLVVLMFWGNGGGEGGGPLGPLLLAQASPARAAICDVHRAFHLKTVTPIWESKALSISGCYSRHTADRSQEVHVLHLKEASGATPINVVTVHVRPMTTQAVHAGPLVLVLYSEFSVNWRLVGHRLTNDTLHRIYVTKGSQVIESKNLNVTIVRRDSGRIKNVLSFVNKRYKALTSYAKIEGANNVYLKVGIGGDAPEKCVIKRKSSVGNVDAFNSEPIPISQRQGCIADGVVGTVDRIVHIVKIHELNDLDATEPEQPHRVAVELRTRDGRPVTRDVALVLQAPTPVVWILQSENVWGRLDVVTDGKLEFPRSTPSQRVGVRTETLPDSNKELLSYSLDWFGPSFAFTEVWKANRVEIVVDNDGEKVPSEKEPHSTSGKEDEEGDDGEKGSSSRVLANKEVVKAHLHRGIADSRSNTMVRVKSSAPSGKNDIIRMPNVMLMRAMTVECLPQHMRVSFPRLTLEQLGLQPVDISLIDSHCSVTVNDTHYVLSSPFHYCGTKRELDNDKIVYKNEVVFHFHMKTVSKSVVGRSVTPEGAPVDDEDSDVGSGAGGIVFPSYESPAATTAEPPRTLQFQCEYIGSNQREEVRKVSSQSQRDVKTLTATRELFKMELYRDPSYVRNVRPTEYPFVAFEHDTLYVETHVDAGPTLRVVTDDCWLSESDDPLANVGIHLIRNTCPAGLTVKFESSGDDTNNRFSFQLASDYVSHPILYVHCKLALCTTDQSHSSRWGLKMCIDPHDFCVTDSLRSYLELSRGTHHTTFTKGPFQVQRRSPNTSTGSRIPFQSNAPLRNQGKLDMEVVGGGGETIDVRCTIPEQQSIIILGLSTEAVVGIAFASFVIGICLSAILWFIYLKTDPLRRSPHRRVTHNSGYDLSGHSGSSTPSSQSPMTA